MDEDKMREIEAAKLRCQLHIRSGKKLLNHSKIVHAIGTLYDALEHAIRWKVLEKKEEWDISEEVIYDTHTSSEILKEKKVLPTEFTFSWFHKIMEDALEDDFDVQAFDSELFWKSLIITFELLGVYPYDEKLLPTENEKTREVLGLD
jgi:hypothetical protein